LAWWLEPSVSKDPHGYRRCWSREPQACPGPHASGRLEAADLKRRQRAFKITGLTWIVERSFAWLGRNRRFSKDYEYRVQTSETMLDIAATRLMLNRLAPA